MKSEINITKTKAENYERQFKITDLQMTSEIDDILQNNTRLQEITKEEWKRQCNVGRREIQNIVAGEKNNDMKNKSMNIFRIKRQRIKHNEKYDGSEDLLEIPQTSENMGKTDAQTVIIRRKPFDDNRNCHRNQQIRPPFHQSESYIHASNNS